MYREVSTSKLKPLIMAPAGLLVAAAAAAAVVARCCRSSSAALFSLAEVSAESAPPMFSVRGRSTQADKVSTQPELLNALCTLKEIADRFPSRPPITRRCVSLSAGVSAGDSA